LQLQPELHLIKVKGGLVKTIVIAFLLPAFAFELVECVRSGAPPQISEALILTNKKASLGLKVGFFYALQVFQ